MIPTPRLLGLLLGLWVAAIFAATGIVSTDAWLVVLVALAVLGALDLVLGMRAPGLRAERHLPNSLPLGVDSRVACRVHSDAHRVLALRLYDHFPPGFEAEGLPRPIALRPGQWTEIRYRVRPEERGEHRFGRIQLRVRSYLGLWERNHLAGEPALVRVYPNFAAVSKYALFAMEQRLSQIGVLKQRRRGEGSEFHQLREYRRGDPLRQVDWRATARLRKLISREYQDERDQTVVFLLDCGRRMRTRDAELSHFDQALNAVLLLAYVALRKGDSVGVGTFGGDERWQAPAKGHETLTRILNMLYDLQPGTLIPDYSRAAIDLLARQRKRALVVIVTNLREEDTDDLQAAIALLKHRHLVLVASLREEAVDQTLDAEVLDFDDALRVAAAHDYLGERDKTLQAMRATGVASVDVLPKALSMELVNAYLAIKARGAL